MGFNGLSAMAKISDFLTEDHRDGDRYLSALEQAVDAGDWAEATKGLDLLGRSLERHFSAEENILFPALEEKKPAASGPVSVMRNEHAQIRHLLVEVRQSLARRDGEDVLGLCETLLLVLQQHNSKEEHVLYPMADYAFGAEAGTVLDRVKASGWNTNSM